MVNNGEIIQKNKEEILLCNVIEINIKIILIYCYIIINRFIIYSKTL